MGGGDHGGGGTTMFFVIVGRVVCGSYRSIYGGGLFRGSPGGRLRARVRVFGVRVNTFVRLDTRLVPSYGKTFGGHRRGQGVGECTRQVFFHLGSTSMGVHWVTSNLRNVREGAR